MAEVHILWDGLSPGVAIYSISDLISVPSSLLSFLVRTSIVSQILLWVNSCFCFLFSI